ncbi:MAG: hypothetical protein R3C56_33635 [Pirellulaceae bacterium]
MRDFKLSLFSVLVFTSLAYGQHTEEAGTTEKTAQRKDVTSSVMIRLIDPLDEPEFYCLDVPGYGPGVQLDNPLTAHTLKAFGSADEMWVLNYPAAGQIYVPAFKRCIEAEHAKSGASLYLKEPGDSLLQRFTMTEKGTIVLAEHTDLGFAVALEMASRRAGRAIWTAEDGSGEPCRDTREAYDVELVKDADRWPE